MMDLAKKILRFKPIRRFEMPLQILRRKVSLKLRTINPSNLPKNCFSMSPVPKDLVSQSIIIVIVSQLLLGVKCLRHCAF